MKYTVIQLVCLALLLLSPGMALAQSGTITGQVIESDSNEPLPGATVLIEGSNIGTTTDSNGEFELTEVPAGTHIVSASFIGYVGTEQEVQISAGEEQELELHLQADIYGLDELVVTGVVGDTEARYTPFSVGRITSDDVQIAPPTSAESALRGRIPGASVSAGSGQPGEGASIQLRGATSLGTTNEPLFIVDGVILGSSTVDIESLDIKNIEVVRGAAAASLYGSRAANGVVQIETQSGAFMDDGNVDITIRNEFGINELAGSVDHLMAHNFAMSDDPDRPWVDADGNPTDDLNARVTESIFMEHDYPDHVETYDNIDRFFNPGNYYNNYVNVRSRFGNTNFSMSFNNTHEQGVLDLLDGYTRRSVRSNVDSDLTDDLSLRFRGYYSWSKRDHVTTGSGSPFFGLAFSLPEVDLLTEDEDGRLMVNPGEVGLEENPLYDVAYNDRTQHRQRIMGSIQADYNITDWFDLSGNFSYDRANQENNYYYPYFWDQIDQNQFPGGGLEYANFYDETMNTSVDATFSQVFGDLQTRSQFRWLMENDDHFYSEKEGNDFTVIDVPTFNNLDQDNVTTESFSTTIRSQGFFGITNFNYDNRYIVDLLGRRDGSSLFGPENRWNNYYRVSGSWNLSNEDFFQVDAVDDLIFRASRGTAGNRPTFSMQYESWEVEDGILSKGNLGNRDLRPEHATENEFGIQLGLLERLLFEVTFSRTVTDDQLLLVSQQGLQGYDAQWRNAGTLESDAIEASLNAFLYESETTSLSMNVNFDRATSKITRFDAPPHRYGSGGGFGFIAQASDVFYYREGEEFGTFYGSLFATEEAELPVNLQDHAHLFDRNDEGYLVPVGEDGSWRDANWGESIEVFDEDGNIVEVLDWGLPVEYVDEDGNNFHRLGNALPDFNLAWGTQMTYRNLGLDMLWEGQFGGQIYNHTRAWAYRDNRHGDFDQRGVSDDERKPISYYQRLYNVNSSSSHFVEDGTFVKLRELALSYRLGAEQLGEMLGSYVDHINFSLVGRNLLTFTEYSGFDPEVGTSESNHIRFDSFNYPNYRTISGSVEIQF